MGLKGLHRLGFAFWLGLLALTAGGVAQNQLFTNVLIAKLAEAGGRPAGGHFMPDGTYMAGPMHGAPSTGMESGTPETADASSGHTHKGHSDCTVCGAVAAMAALSVPILNTIKIPDIIAPSLDGTSERTLLPRSPRAPYASRAPPTLIG